MREAAAQGANIILLQVGHDGARQHACRPVIARGLHRRPHCTSFCQMLILQMHAQELFATPYFCQEQTDEHFKIAQVGFCPVLSTRRVLPMLNIQRSASDACTAAFR